MSYATVIAAVIDRYDAFTFTGKPATLFQDGIAPKTSAGAVTLPTANLTDDGTTVEYDLEGNPLETTRFTLTVRGARAAVDSISSGIRFNGGAVTAGLGMDRARTLSLTGLTLLAPISRVSEQSVREDASDANGDPVYRNEMRYEVYCLRTA